MSAGQLQAGLRWEYRRQPVDNPLAAFFPLCKAYQPGEARVLTALPDEADVLQNGYSIVVVYSFYVSHISVE